MSDFSVNLTTAIKSGLVDVGRNLNISQNVIFRGRDAYGATIGDNVTIEDYTIIKYGANIQSDVRISSCVRMEEFCTIEERTFIGHSTVLRPNTRISSDCVIGHLCVFEGDSQIGEGTLINAQCNITKGVRIGSKVFIAPLFCGANDSRMCHARRDKIIYVENPYTIEDKARIAIGVSVLPGVVIGENSVIGAHSLVTKDVPKMAVVRGVPARIVGEVSRKELL